MSDLWDVTDFFETTIEKHPLAQGLYGSPDTGS